MNIYEITIDGNFIGTIVEQSFASAAISTMHVTGREEAEILTVKCLNNGKSRTYYETWFDSDGDFTADWWN